MMIAPHESRTTTDHEEIRRWVEQRGGRPARVQGTGGAGDPGLLRIDMPEGQQPERGSRSDQSLEPIPWDEFFDKFDKEELAFVYQEQTQEGEVSRFSKIVSR